MTVCLHTHRLTTGAHGEAGKVRPRQTGRPEEALPQAFTTASLSELLWPRNLHNTHCCEDQGSSHTEGKRVRRREVMSTRTERHNAALKSVKGKLKSEMKRMRTQRRERKET